MILVLSSQHDPHARAVTQKLTQRGAEFLWYDPAEFPARSRITVSLGAPGPSCYVLSHQGRQFNLRHLSAVWHRRPGIPEPDESIAADGLRKWLVAESQSFIQGIWNTLDCVHVPAVDHIRYAAENKLLQLVTAARLGFSLPRTAITNEPACLLDCFTQFGGAAITKVFSNPLVTRDGGSDIDSEEWSSYSRPVQRRDLGYHRSIRHAPTIVQEYVPKSVEIRATVVGVRVFAAAIHSQRSRRSRHDWRHYDRDKVLYEEHELPPQITRLCVDLTKALNLTFGAIDLVLRPDGEYVFLEINPSGQWLWIENLTGLPIADGLADLLMDAPRAG
jgi:RimK-like ATP-grasp domain